jgi:hypothetical protein
MSLKPIFEDDFFSVLDFEAARGLSLTGCFRLKGDRDLGIDETQTNTPNNPVLSFVSISLYENLC